MMMRDIWGAKMQVSTLFQLSIEHTAEGPTQGITCSGVSSSPAVALGYAASERSAPKSPQRTTPMMYSQVGEGFVTGRNTTTGWGAGKAR